jgi:hypothetical protein
VPDDRRDPQGRDSVVVGCVRVGDGQNVEPGSQLERCCYCLNPVWTTPGLVPESAQPWYVCSRCIEDLPPGTVPESYAAFAASLNRDIDRRKKSGLAPG